MTRPQVLPCNLITQASPTEILICPLGRVGKVVCNRGSIWYVVSFFRYDVNNDHYLDLMEMKQMMEKLGAPQTHVGLKAMIAEIDEDNDGKVSFREVIIIPVLHIFFLRIITASGVGWRVSIN